MKKTDPEFVKLAMDMHRYIGRDVEPRLRSLLSTTYRQPGFLAVWLYRTMTKQYRLGRKSRAQLVYWVNLMLTRADILPGSRIGGGLMIRHATGIVIGAGAELGEYCTILQNVTVGAKDASSGDRASYPSIGDRVVLGAGSLVIGGIAIGSDAVVGAGAVVVRDVAASSIAVGNPARGVPPRHGDR